MPDPGERFRIHTVPHGKCVLPEGRDPEASHLFTSGRSLKVSQSAGHSPTASEQVPPSSAQQPAEDAKPVYVFRPTLDALTDEMIRFNRTAAEKQLVMPAVHSKDYTYWFCATHPLHTTESGINYYFENGGDSARKVAEMAASLGFTKDRPVKLLEFASGYGCVTRHLVKDDWFDLTSCDIHPAAMEFLAHGLGVKTVTSHAIPEQFSATEKYDIVFALSFFTHMPRSSFARWLRALFRVLKAPGYLAFTTDGLRSCTGLQIKPEVIPADGFWFRPESEYKDLDAAEYGLSLTTPDFMIGEISRTLGSPVALYRHAYWWYEHDLWVVKREK
jgi:SAM-dependent methyltransferase